MPSTKNRHGVRQDGTATMTIPVDEAFKESLRARAQAASTPARTITMADLVRMALYWHEGRGWKDIPELQPKK